MGFCFFLILSCVPASVYFGSYRVSSAPTPSLAHLLSAASIAMTGLRSHIAVLETLDGEPLPIAKNGVVASLQAYQASRKSLVEEEIAQRFDADKRRTLTDDEKRADEIVEALKRGEDEHIYNRPGDHSALPGMDWEGAKARGVRNGKLYSVIAKVRQECRVGGGV